MTQPGRILNHLRMQGSITSLEAIRDYGITRLSAAIYTLRRMGYNIHAETVSVQNRYGDTCHVARYKLQEEV